LFRDMTIHDFDMARWLLGEEPVEVFAWGGALVDPKVAESGDIDSAMVLLRTASERLCHINNSRRAAYGYDQRIEVFGSKGMLRAENRTPTTVERSDDQASARDKPLHLFLERHAHAYRADLEVDAVLIASSTGSHAELSIAAARAGKAIFCEKPIDLDLERADACIREVEKAGVPMFVGFNRRFDPSFRALKKRIDAGEIGRLEQVLITNRDPGLPELRFLASSGGLFLDFTIHDFDMARWLLGEEPVEVFAWGAVLVDRRVKTVARDIDS